MADEATRRRDESEIGESIGAAVNARAPRVWFANYHTGEEYGLPIVPTSFDETVNVEYARHQILGMSHQPLQFGSVSNYSIQGLVLPFRATSRAELKNIHEGRKFLMSLAYPPRGDFGGRAGGPPRVLFVWPGLVSIACKTMGLNITHERFNKEGMSVAFTATITLEEIRDVRLTSEDVREFGTERVDYLDFLNEVG